MYEIAVTRFDKMENHEKYYIQYMPMCRCMRISLNIKRSSFIFDDNYSSRSLYTDGLPNNTCY